jgi:hypothetical protein
MSVLLICIIDVEHISQCALASIPANDLGDKTPWSTMAKQPHCMEHF